MLTLGVLTSLPHILRMAPFATLLERARSGDEPALEEVLLSVEGQLRQHVQNRLGEQLRQSVRNSDILQNAYLELLRSLPTLKAETEGEFVAWVCKVIERDIHRQARWFGAAKRKAPESTSEFNALAKILIGSSSTPSAEVSLSEESERVHRAFDELSEEHRRVLELAVFQELSHKAVAERMSRSEAATRMLLFRARAALGLAMERLRPDSP